MSWKGNLADTQSVICGNTSHPSTDTLHRLTTAYTKTDTYRLTPAEELSKLNSARPPRPPRTAVNQASLVRFRRPTVSRSHPNSPGGGCAFRCHSARLTSGGGCSSDDSGSGAARFRPLLRSLAGALAGLFLAGLLAGVLAGVLAGDLERAAACLAGVPALALAGDALGALAGDALAALTGDAFGALAGDAFGVLAPPALLGEAALFLEGVLDRGSVLKLPLTITRSADRSCHLTSPSV